MGHGPAVKLGRDDAATYKTRLGIWMFILYTLVYAGFVVINAVWPDLMAKIVFGQTLAVVYGFGLIGFALVLAMIYNKFCTAAEKRMNQ
ncbi:MAG TPA: DUF485 domain-containing protein [Desulfuromonadales bacterium]|nr:DUF485 domain-containing protein [Desulfuromonadales bacterium]